MRLTSTRPLSSLPSNLNGWILIKTKKCLNRWHSARFKKSVLILPIVSLIARSPLINQILKDRAVQKRPQIKNSTSNSRPTAPSKPSKNSRITKMYWNRANHRSRTTISNESWCLTNQWKIETFPVTGSMTTTTHNRSSEKATQSTNEQIKNLQLSDLKLRKHQVPRRKCQMSRWGGGRPVRRKTFKSFKHRRSGTQSYTKIGGCRSTSARLCTQRWAKSRRSRCSRVSTSRRTLKTYLTSVVSWQVDKMSRCWLSIPTTR